MVVAMLFMRRPSPRGSPSMTGAMWQRSENSRCTSSCSGSDGRTNTSGFGAPSPAAPAHPPSSVTYHGTGPAPALGYQS